MKGQFTTINISGAAISAVLLVSSQFSSVQRLFCRALIRNARGTNLVLDQPTEAVSCSANIKLELDDSAENNAQISYEETPIGIKLPKLIIAKANVLNENDIEVFNEIAQLEPHYSHEVEKEVREINPEENSLIDEISKTETAFSNKNPGSIPEDTIANVSDEINIVETQDANKKTSKICTNDATTEENETTLIQTDTTEKATIEISTESIIPVESTTNEKSIITDIPKIETKEAINYPYCEASKKPRKSRTRRPRVIKVSELEIQNPKPLIEQSDIEQEFYALLKITEANAKVGKDTQLVETQSTCTTVKNPEAVSESHGCPKNLVYYHQKPRPKQTPEECMTCSNLIACVCLTSN